MQRASEQRHVQFHCGRIRIGPQRLKYGSDVQFAEARSIILMNELQVHYLVTIFGHAVGIAHRLESVERASDSRVSNSVNMYLETHFVETPKIAVDDILFVKVLD